MSDVREEEMARRDCDFSEDTVGVDITTGNPFLAFKRNNRSNSNDRDVPKLRPNVNAPSFTPSNVIRSAGQAPPFVPKATAPTNPIAPPKFQGRHPSGGKPASGSHGATLSPREKLQMGAEQAGGKVLSNTTPFRKEESHHMERPDPIRHKDQTAVFKRFSQNLLRDLPAGEREAENAAVKCMEAAVTNGTQLTEAQAQAFEKLTSIFSQDQAKAIQGAINSILGQSKGPNSTGSSDHPVSADADETEAFPPTAGEIQLTPVSAGYMSGGTSETNAHYGDIPRPQHSQHHPQKSKRYHGMYGFPYGNGYEGAEGSRGHYEMPPGMSNPYEIIGGSSTAGLPLHLLQNAYSRKVFVGGLPPDIDEEEIKHHFSKYGKLSVDWPHKADSKSIFPPKGYAFLLFQSEDSVHKLVQQCSRHESKYYMIVNSPSIKEKQVQIRPWLLSDSDYVMDSTEPLDPRKTIFVGGVPRPLRAHELATVMNQYYGGVCYAGIDTDPELKYPKGAGRVAFSNQQSYIAAISARFVQLKHGEIDKRVEVKPYVLDDQLCDECQGQRNGGKFAPYFCANITCLQYYCETCWKLIHQTPGRSFHKPLVKEGAERSGLTAAVLSNLTGGGGSKPPSSSGRGSMGHPMGSGGFFTPGKGSIGMSASNPSSSDASPRSKGDKMDGGRWGYGPPGGYLDGGPGYMGRPGPHYGRSARMMNASGFMGGPPAPAAPHDYDYCDSRAPNLSQMSLQQAAAAAAAWQKQQGIPDGKPGGSPWGGSRNSSGSAVQDTEYEDTRRSGPPSGRNGGGGGSWYGPNQWSVGR